MDNFSFLGNMCHVLLTQLKIMKIKTNNVRKEHLFNKTRQYNIQTFYKIIIFKCRTRHIKATETNK